jgi:hypothetical protein
MEKLIELSRISIPGTSLVSGEVFIVAALLITCVVMEVVSWKRHGESAFF